MNTRELLAAVPREPFVPDTIFVRDEVGVPVPLRRADDPERWRTMVDADAPIITRIAGDPDLPADLIDPATGKGMISSSSSSAPFIMARLIKAMELRPGMRVMEIGTGTGHNAAVLAHLVGAGNVVSVEIDPVAADHARKALESVRIPVEVVTGDGEVGHLPGEPYDRVVATASARTVPYTWVRQTRPGGLIVAPLAPTVHPEWPLAVLKVQDDGTAQGRCVASSPFMALRAQTVDHRSANEAEDRWEAAGEPELTRYGVTITPEGQRIWLDHPDGQIR